MNHDNDIASVIFDSMEEAALIINPDFSIDSINKKGKELFGEINANGKPLKCYELICKNAEPDGNCPILCFKNNRTLNNDYLLKSKGHYFKVKISKLPVADNEFKYLNVLHDVTKEVMAEKEQKEAREEFETLNEEYLTLIEELEEKNRLINKEREKFEHLFTNMNSAFALHEIILDENGVPCDYRFIECNNMFEEQTGLKRKDIIGKTVLEVLPDTEKYWIDTYGKVALTGEPYNFTNYAKELDKYFETRSYSPQKGFFAVSFNDVTAEKKAMEEVMNEKKRAEDNNQLMLEKKEQYEKLNKQLNNANSELELHNERLESLLKIAKFNTRSKQELLDYALEEAISLTQSKIGYIYFYNEKTKQFILNTWSKEVMKECRVMNPQTMYNLDSTGCWGEVVRQQKPIVINNYSAPHKHKKGTPAGHVALTKFMSIPVLVNDTIVAVAGVANKQNDYTQTDVRQLTLLMDNVWNICERLDLIEKLNTEKIKAEKANHLKSAFLANMSHEIRTPLNGLMGFAEVMANKADLTKGQQQNFAKIIQKSSDQLLQIVNDILDISSLESGTLEVVPKEFDVNQFLYETYDLYSQKISSEELSLFIKVIPVNGFVILNADENRVLQILTNLLNNAIKFTSEGVIEFGVQEVSADKVLFYVKDSGIGIDKEQQEVIFDRFRQAEMSINRVYGGNGLGLSIVKELLRLMGGEIWVESEVGKGSTFYFTLPYSASELNSETNISLKLDTEPNYTINSKLRVLVVEDDLINQAYMRELLSEIEVDVTIVELGNEAIHLAKENKYDVILMDIRLPDINGFEVTKEIRKFNSKVPIIAQTAYAMSSDEEEAYRSGCSDYVSKPIKRDLLLKKLNLVTKDYV